MPVCMEYCFHIWGGASSCYLELLDKLQKQICRTVSPSLLASLEPLAHHENVASLSLLYRYYFGSCSSELVPRPFSQGGLLDILLDCMIFLSPFKSRINRNLYFLHALIFLCFFFL